MKHGTNYQDIIAFLMLVKKFNDRFYHFLPWHLEKLYCSMKPWHWLDYETICQIN